MIDVQEYHRLFRYDHVTGKLFNRIARASRSPAGREAGSPTPDGYRTVMAMGARALTHRIVWEMFRGAVRDRLEIDHINGDKSDNRLANLRVVDRRENSRNKSINKNNTSGALGVSWHSQNQKWRAYIMVDFKQVSLGLFTELSAAVKARKRAEVKYGFHSNHGRA